MLLRWMKKIYERWRAKRKEVGGLRGRGMDSKRKNEAMSSVGVGRMVWRDGNCMQSSDMLNTPYPVPSCHRASDRRLSTRHGIEWEGMKSVGGLGKRMANAVMIKVHERGGLG